MSQQTGQKFETHGQKQGAEKFEYRKTIVSDVDPKTGKKPNGGFYTDEDFDIDNAYLASMEASETASTKQALDELEKISTPLLDRINDVEKREKLSAFFSEQKRLIQQNSELQAFSMNEFRRNTLKKMNACLIAAERTLFQELEEAKVEKIKQKIARERPENLRRLDETSLSGLNGEFIRQMRKTAEETRERLKRLDQEIRRQQASQGQGVNNQTFARDFAEFTRSFWRQQSQPNSEASGFGSAKTDQQQEGQKNSSSSQENPKKESGSTNESGAARHFNLSEAETTSLFSLGTGYIGGKSGLAELAKKILGVTDGNDSEAVKRAWRKAAMELHPDRTQDPLASEKFKIIQVFREKYNAAFGS
jgi:hypothetical protein